MGLSRRQFSKEFKLAAVRRLEQGASRAEVARTLECESQRARPLAVGASQGTLEALLPGMGKSRAVPDSQIAQLERKVGQQALEIDFLKGTCSASTNSGCCEH